jgi:hypothetical protein
VTHNLHTVRPDAKVVTTTVSLCGGVVLRAVEATDSLHASVDGSLHHVGRSLARYHKKAADARNNHASNLILSGIYTDPAIIDEQYEPESVAAVGASSLTKMNSTAIDSWFRKTASGLASVYNWAQEALKAKRALSLSSPVPRSIMKTENIIVDTALGNSSSTSVSSNFLQGIVQTVFRFAKARWPSVILALILVTIFNVSSAAWLLDPIVGSF